MKRRFRLTRSTDFERVRRTGKSYAHPLIVLVVLPNNADLVHCGVAAGRSVGGAVERNRAKRHIRAVIAAQVKNLQPGWDLVFLARKPMNQAAFPEIQNAVLSTLRRAHILREVNEV